MRLICVSSIFQFILALSCASYNDKEKKLKNIILITNPNFHRNNMKKIFFFKKYFDIELIINSSKFVKNLNDKNYINFKNFLKKKIKFQIEEILVRYKFNITEHVIFSTFPKAKISIFEDGIGDYMKYELLSGQRKKNLFKIFILKIYYVIFKNTTYFNFLNNNLYKDRIENKFELISDYNGHLKNQHVSKKKFLSIRKFFYNTLKMLNKKNSIRFKKKTVLILLHDIDDYKGTQKQKNEELKKNIDHFLMFLNKIKKKYKYYKFVIKGHPNIKKSTIKKLKEKYNLDILDTNHITETLLINKNIKVVAGFLSSSLIYSKKIFKKITLSVDTKNLDVHSVQDQENSIYDVIKRYGIKVI